MIINACVSIYDPTESIARSYQKAVAYGKPDHAFHTKVAVCLHSNCPIRINLVKLG